MLMKKRTLIVFLILLVLWTFTSAMYANENIIVKFDHYKIEHGKGIASYTVYSEKSRNCDLSFLALPAEDINGNFPSYTIQINGSELAEKITFDLPGWQEIDTHNKDIVLNKGENTLSFISSGKDLPQIKGIEIFNENKKSALKNKILPTASDFKENKIAFHKEKSREIRSEITDTEPLYRPGVAFNQPHSYTFFIPLYYEAGDRASFYGPTASDPRFGMYESTIEYTVYFFNEKPELFSESATSNNKYLFWQIDSIPYTGVYYMLVEAKNQGEWGGVSLLINNNMLYKYSFVSNCTFAVFKDAPNGNIYVTNSDSCYNIFTINGKSGDQYHDADPCLWLKKHDYNDGSSSIVAYNDNNSVLSDFDWGNNARIRIPLSNSASYNVLLSSSYPMYFTNDTCDLYHSFWNNPDTICLTTSELNLPNLKYEDAIESSKPVWDYNCFSWSAGITHGQIWTIDGELTLEGFDRLYNNETVQADFGKIVRPKSYPRYTRANATEENSVVDLWGRIENGKANIAHASIRNYSDGVPHGYDWESKLGGGFIRIFHPRYAMSGYYGNVIANYRMADGQDVSNNNPQIMMAKAIADGELIIENILLTPEEKDLISCEISCVPKKKTDEFELLYNSWKHYVSQRKYDSNMLNFKKCEEYTELLNLLNSFLKGEFLVYDKFIEGDFLASILIMDLSTKPGSRTKFQWDSIMEAPLVNNIVRTPTANITLFIKSILQKGEIPEKEGIIHSNDDEFNVITSPSQLTVNVDIKESSKYAVRIMNLTTNSTHELVPERNIPKGKYTHICNVSPGLYIVTYILNDNINSKKIVVH